MFDFEIHWLALIRELIVLVAGIALLIRARGKRDAWLVAIGWLLIGVVVAGFFAPSP